MAFVACRGSRVAGVEFHQTRNPCQWAWYIYGIACRSRLYSYGVSVGCSCVSSSRARKIELQAGSAHLSVLCNRRTNDAAEPLVLRERSFEYHAHHMKLSFLQSVCCASCMHSPEHSQSSSMAWLLKAIACHRVMPLAGRLVQCAMR